MKSMVQSLVLYRVHIQEVHHLLSRLYKHNVFLESSNNLEFLLEALVIDVVFSFFQGRDSYPSNEDKPK